MALHANNEFIGACLDFDALLQRLQALRGEHFGVVAEAQRNWGEVGSVKHANELLAEAVRFLTGVEG